MKISHQNIDDLNAVITVELSPEDYNTQVDKAIKEQAKKAKLPGFRPGMVPTGHIRRTFGKSILFDEVNKLVNESLSGYVDEQKLNILGQPLPDENDTTEYKWNFEDTFVFKYDIGLAPEIENPFKNTSEFKEYTIKVDEETLESRIKNLRKSYGKMSSPEVSEEGDVLYTSFIEIDADNNEVEGGINRAGSLRTDLIQDKDIVKSLIGLKKEDTLNIDLKKALTSAEIARMLSFTEEEVEKLTNSTFKATIKSINRLEESELNEEFYAKVFGEGQVKTEEEFRNKVKEEVESMLTQNSAQKLQNDLYTYGMDQVKIELPEPFLKRWLKATNPSIQDNELEEGFGDFIKNLKWTLIENQIIKENNLEIKYEEVLNIAKERISAQIRLYGQMELPDDAQLGQYAMQLLQDKEQANRLFEEAKALKVFDHLKGLVKLNNEEIEYNKFLELVNQ